MPTRAESCARIGSPVGPIHLAADADGLTHLLFAHPAETLLPAGDSTAAAGRIVARAARQLGQYFEGHRRDFDIPLAPRGTAFQLAVWRALRKVPFGATASYGDIARRIGRANAVRAVGAANGANPIAIIVPCHRVIAGDGRLHGYGGGLSVKQTLLELEGLVIRAGRVVEERVAP